MKLRLLYIKLWVEGEMGGAVAKGLVNGLDMRITLDVEQGPINDAKYHAMRLRA